VDASVNEQLTFLDWQKTTGDDSLKIAATREDKARNAFAFRSGSDDLAKAITLALTKLRDNGTHATGADVRRLLRPSDDRGHSPWPSAIIALSRNVGGYAAEVIRAAILSVPKGKWDAAYMIGMPRRQSLRRRTPAAPRSEPLHPHLRDRLNRDQRLRRLPPHRARRHPGGDRRDRPVPALRQRRLGHRRDLGRGRRRNGRTQLNPRIRWRSAPADPVPDRRRRSL